MIQSILFHQEAWTIDQAINWLSRHGFVYPKIDETENYYRFRQMPPRPGARYSTKDLGRGIKVIVMN